MEKELQVDIKMINGESLLQARNITKRFSGTAVLKDIHLEVNRGQVCALAGENGAGKSTLGKILSGLYRQDSGEIFWKGNPVQWQNPHQALRSGIAMIHQELMPFPNLSVAENICMGQEPTGGILGMIDGPARDRIAREALARLGASLSPAKKMKELTIAEMQIVEIAKAMAYQAEMIIMDEPTSAISQREVEILLDIIHELKANGIAIIYISHKLDEIFRIADTIDVLRDGRHIASGPMGEWDESRLIAAMVGRELDSFEPVASPQLGPIVLEVRRLTRPGKFREISFSLHRGEILGLTGLMGAGRTDLLQTLYGLEPALSGEIILNGHIIQIRSPREAVDAGLAWVSEDRQEYGLIPEMSVKDNLTLANLSLCCHRGLINSNREKSLADKQIKQFSIKVSNRLQKVRSVSGGNQQKVIIARALLTGPSILLLDEPTRGIDIGAKEEVYRIITQLAAGGMAILLASSELPEILRLSMRILVMRQGEICAELPSHSASQEEILKFAMPH